MNGQELLRPENAERLEDLWTNLVLPAVAARRGHERRPHPAAVAHHRQQPVVLVVGMRVRLHERAGRGELPQHQPERDVGRELTDRLDAQLRGRELPRSTSSSVETKMRVGRMEDSIAETSLGGDEGHGTSLNTETRRHGEYGSLAESGWREARSGQRGCFSVPPCLRVDLVPCAPSPPSTQLSSENELEPQLHDPLVVSALAGRRVVTPIDHDRRWRERPAHSVVTTRLTPAMFSVLKRFFASKNSSAFIASRNGMKRE